MTHELRAEELTAARTLTLPQRNDGGPLQNSLFFVGTATTVINLAGFTILTDPNFLHAGQHVHLGFGLIAERLTEPAIDIDELPVLDFCLLSHMHGDHWDRIASEKLRKDLPIITTRTAAKRLTKEGFLRTTPLSKWESVLITKGERRMRVTSMPGKHGPGVMNVLLPKVMGSMIEVEKPSGGLYRLYISGDTLLHEDLAKIHQMFSGIDLALVHLGGTRAFGILVTMDAAQGIKFLQIIRPCEAVPIHYDDYSVFKSPLSDFVQALKAANLSTKVTFVERGQSLPINLH